MNREVTKASYTKQDEAPPLRICPSIGIKWHDVCISSNANVQFMSLSPEHSDKLETTSCRAATKLCQGREKIGRGLATAHAFPSNSSGTWQKVDAIKQSGFRCGKLKKTSLFGKRVPAGRGVISWSRQNTTS